MQRSLAQSKERFERTRKLDSEGTRVDHLTTTNLRRLFPQDERHAPDYELVTRDACNASQPRGLPSLM